MTVWVQFAAEHKGAVNGVIRAKPYKQGELMQLPLEEARRLAAAGTVEILSDEELESLGNR